MYKKSFSLSILLYLLSLTVYSATPPTSDIIDSAIVFDDKQLEEAVAYPDWFKFSLGDLNDDLAEAKKAGKKGIITYFGQKRCAYCEQFFKSSLSDVDIKNYLQKHFDLIAFDIWGIDDITDTDGTTYTERDLSIHYKTNFTPSLVFYNAEGTPVFRLRGFYPPYKFRAALQYVTEEFYKEETFSDYFAPRQPGRIFPVGWLNRT